jgi:hypothetical protein
MNFDAVTFDALLLNFESEFQFVGFPVATRHSVVAEHIRAAFAMASLSGDDGVPVQMSSAKIAASVRRRVQLLWPEFEFTGQDSPMTIGYEIRVLNELNEIWKSASGTFIASPPRLLIINEMNALLCGGGPVQMLPHSVRLNLQQAGRARVVKMTEAVRRDTQSLAIQRFSDWLGHPGESARTWSRTFLSRLALAPVEDGEAEGLTFFNGRTWVALCELPMPLGHRLARKQVSIFGSPSSHYFICDVRSIRTGPPAVTTIIRIDRQDARRLQGVLGLDDGVNRELPCIFNENTICIRVFWPLPEPEAKVLHLGWRTTLTEDDDAWPREYWFSARLQPLLEEAFLMLGYRLNYKEETKHEH